MYPTAYYTYNPTRMKKAERAYFKQGKNSIFVFVMPCLLGHDPHLYSFCRLFKSFVLNIQILVRPSYILRWGKLGSFSKGKEC